ncbi:hypothetical protein V1511DRAFT_505394 [Dipodascopsis uninucleata]
MDNEQESSADVIVSSTVVIPAKRTTRGASVESQSESATLPDDSATPEDQEGIVDSIQAEKMSKEKDPKLEHKPKRDSKRSMAEEKGRNKRMFGALLTSLNRSDKEDSSSRKARYKNADHENELRRNRLEKEQANSRKRLERAMFVKHGDLRANAKQLHTKSEPVLRFQPVELTDEQQKIIDDQIIEAERQIELDIEEFERESGVSNLTTASSAK